MLVNELIKEFSSFSPTRSQRTKGAAWVKIVVVVVNSNTPPS
jgi:hypothetical protein